VTSIAHPTNRSYGLAPGLNHSGSSLETQVPARIVVYRRNDACLHFRKLFVQSIALILLADLPSLALRN
jgi:hypothetical protein